MTAFSDVPAIPHPYDNPRFEKLYATLRQPSSQIADNTTLREALQSLEYSIQSTVWLDRRIDGEQVVHLVAGERNHLETIELLNTQTNTETAWLENIIYIAPTGQSSRIETAYWNLFSSRDTPNFRKALPAVEWTTSVEANEVFQRLAKAGSIKFEGLETIPHDRWNRFKWSGSSLACCWSCALAGFDQTITKQPLGAWQVEKIGDSNSVEFEYHHLAKKFSPVVLKQWRSQWPNVAVKTISEGRIQITAPVAAHRELITMELNRKQPEPASKKVGPDKSRYTLTLQGTIGEQLPPLMKQLGLELRPWPLDEAVMKRRIEVTLKDAGIDEMLNAIASKAAVEIKRVGKTVEVK